MAIQKKRLRVFPNAWQYIDHLGRAAGACPCDPNEHTPDRRWVGATIDKAVVIREARTVQIAGQSFVQRDASHDITWEHEDSAVEIPNTAYYRQRIAGGELVAADTETAEACGISRAEFVEPKAFLEKAKAAAIVQFDAENGVGAYAYFEAERAEAAKAIKAAEDAAKPAAPAPAKQAPPPVASKGDS